MAAALATSAYALDFDGLIAAYTYDEGSGDTAEDISGNGFDGTIVDGNWVTGVFGEAIEFTGGQSHMFADGVLSSVPNNAITLGAWFQLQDHPAYEGIIGGSDPDLGGCCQYRIMIEPGFAPFYNAGAHTDVTVAGVVTEGGVWYHYVMTIDGDVKIYLDGEVVGEGIAAADPLPELATPLLVGTGESPGTWPLFGLVDEVVVFDRAISEDEVNELKDSGLVVAMAVDARGKLALQWAGLKSDR
ncbi:LamG domain-containing protein [Candidatus Poribacteria bacterium]|jgi:hypothetical protein|nr:LamG domain-containing protein [Candidatus Poribacteria bacterium]